MKYNYRRTIDKIEETDTHVILDKYYENIIDLNNLIFNGNYKKLNSTTITRLTCNKF